MYKYERQASRNTLEIKVEYKLASGGQQVELSISGRLEVDPYSSTTRQFMEAESEFYHRAGGVLSDLIDAVKAVLPPDILDEGSWGVLPLRRDMLHHAGDTLEAEKGALVWSTLPTWEPGVDIQDFWRQAKLVETFKATF